ncbi:cupin [Emticicia sp. BO119]|uniref:cupin n=1 Tax=Emticicia sp. BO119 TaxID=2757768 RepID=UPI0015F114C3|nr:cupin [Emticicia sp. BO119]MBA4849416.1 cupin [Emticicia sp. BO119]
MNHKLETYRFSDDGHIPNNILPVILYRQVTKAKDKSEWFENTFKTNGWTNNWRDVIYRCDHFHSTTHEVLGVGKGTVIMHIGGQMGISIEVSAGDVLILPAGTGHSAISEHINYEIVSGYPQGRKWDVLLGTAEERKQAIPRIEKLPVPSEDPVFGKDGELLRLWQ